jgi:hypothetical protein
MGRYGYDHIKVCFSRATLTVLVKALFILFFPPLALSCLGVYVYATYYAFDDYLWCTWGRNGSFAGA